jgi:hypothetical protein
MIKLKSGFGEYTADGLVHLGEDVVSNLGNLPIFATLTPAPAAITAAATALDNAIKMIGPGRKQASAGAFDTLAGLLAEVAVNAPQVTGVTDTQLAEIGLPVIKTPTRTTQPPGQCQNLRLFQNGQAGMVLGRCAAMGDNTRVYEGQWTLDPNGESWSEPATFPNSRAFRFAGLTRGKDIWIRVRARNTIGAGPWSDPATIMVA